MVGVVGAMGAAGGAWAALGGDDPTRPVTMTPESRADPVAVPHTALQGRTKVGPAAYSYEVDGKAATYFVTPTFGARLDRWMATWREHSGLVPDEVRSYGAWTAGGGTSWHSSGEAFDIARLRAGGKDLTSSRYDQWRDGPAAERRRAQRLYWRHRGGPAHTSSPTSLTYLFDAAHSNHIHVDIGRFGPTGAAAAHRRSGAQVQAVQAMCRHVWGRTDVQVTGEFDT